MTYTYRRVYVYVCMYLYVCMHEVESQHSSHSGSTVDLVKICCNEPTLMITESCAIGTHCYNKQDDSAGPETVPKNAFQGMS
jgi:hypothetical protein